MDTCTSIVLILIDSHIVCEKYSFRKYIYKNHTNVLYHCVKSETLNSGRELRNIQSWKLSYSFLMTQRFY